jgi:hypothetical protein
MGSNSPTVCPNTVSIAEGKNAGGRTIGRSTVNSGGIVRSGLEPGEPAQGGNALDHQQALGR